MSCKKIAKMIAQKLGIKEYISAKKKKKQTQHFNKGNKVLLFKLDEVLNQNGLQYWLNYGTLLGAYRDHDFINHDYDLDI